MRKLTSAVAGAVMAFAGLTAVASAPAQAATGMEYVALGDSYASGVGAGFYDSSSGDCKRSTLNYPAQSTAAHDGYTLKDVSCSGATLADVRNKQLSALSSDTDLVSITVGGNDVQFANLVQGCLTQSDSYCQTGTLYMSYYAKGQLATSLTDLYNEIKTRAPHAKVVVLGYPQVVAASGSCGALDLTPAKRTAMNGLADALAEGTQAAAAKASVTYVDMRKTFKGHEACGTDPWINGVNLTDLTSTFHPTLTGYMMYADQLNSAWG